MFSLGHFIWLGAIGVAIALALITAKKLTLSHRTVGRAVMMILIVLKIFHLSLSMKQSGFGGYVIDQPQLSFHLCSLMIYSTVLVNTIKNEKIVAALKSFMVPCLFIGAAMALLIPTEGVDPAAPRVWQYMLIHGVHVFYGIYLATVEKVDLSFKAYVNNLKMLLGVTLLAFLMNSVLEQYGTNFLFLRVPPMENLPLLNLNNGWGVYILTLAVIACLLTFFIHLPFIVSNSAKKRKERIREAALETVSLDGFSK